MTSSSASDSSSLPIVNPAGAATTSRRPDRPVRRWLIHLIRISLFLLILLLVRWSQHRIAFSYRSLREEAFAIELVEQEFGPGVQIGRWDAQLDGHYLIDEAGNKRGSLVQTSPSCDSIIGYSGPTNCLIVLDESNQILRLSLIKSGDTDEHVALVEDSSAFFESFQGLGFESGNAWREIDAVSGATLTSYAIIASVAQRLQGEEPSLKFESAPRLSSVQKLFPAAERIEKAEAELGEASVWQVKNDTGEPIGLVMSTSPAADHLSGYQGPTATIVGFDANRICTGLVVDQTYDNQPYASYLDDDSFFQEYYVGRSMAELARLNPATSGIDGVSGATMTSMAVAEGLMLAAQSATKPGPERRAQTASSTRSWQSYWADGVTLVLILVGLVMSFSRLRRPAVARLIFQAAFIWLLGFTSGHMLSQAQLAGWAAHGIPWQVTPGLVLLTLAAFAVPMVSRRQMYCQHLCPFGAIQQLVRNRIGWKLPLSRQLTRILEVGPWLLLAGVVWVAVSGADVNLAAWEPFDAFGWSAAGWGTLAVFLVAIVVSLVSPMAYCRFGCPTGAVLSFLKLRADSDRLGWRDLGACGLVLIAALSLL